VPEEPWEPFQGTNHISNFARSGVLSVFELMTHGFLESDSAVADRFKLLPDATCQPAAQPPHIIILLDESSFDITAAPGIKVPPGYERHFRSFDGKARSFLVEASGGPTWYAEYNVLTGLSARSFGRFKFNVTRIAAGRVERGLPQALRRCGYKTFSLYPFYGTFLGARMFQTTTGIEHFIDLREMGVKSDLQPDHFFYDQALRLIERERGGPPLFIFVYVAVNHFPWNWTFRADLTPDWKELGNEPQVDEYIRRQTMSAARLCRLPYSPAPGLSEGFVSPAALRRPPARHICKNSQSVARRRCRQATFHVVRPAIFLDLLRDRHYQFQTGRFVLGTRYPRRALPAAGHPGGRRLAA
jgi:hypothetical protein